MEQALWFGVKKKVPLGTYNFVFISVSMKEGEVFIISHIDLLSKSTNHRIAKRAKRNRKNAHPRASPNVPGHQPRIKGWGWGLGEAEGFARVTLVSGPGDLAPSHGSDVIQPPRWFSGMLPQRTPLSWADHVL